MSEKYELELPPFEPLNCSNPTSAREWADIEFKFISDIVDELCEMDLPVRAYDRISRLWESVAIMHYILTTKVKAWKDDDRS